MSTAARILLALSEKNMTAYDLSAELSISMLQARSALTELVNRVLAVPVTKRIKTYSLTTLGQMEAQRMKALGVERTKTPREPEPGNDVMVAEAISKRDLLSTAWGGANA